MTVSRDADGFMYCPLKEDALCACGGEGPLTVLDGEPLCHSCAKRWARGESPQLTPRERYESQREDERKQGD